MNEILFAWLGPEDFEAVNGKRKRAPGPILGALQERSFSQIHLLDSREPIHGKGYQKWLSGQTTAKVTVHSRPLSHPLLLGEIYEAAAGVLEGVDENLHGQTYRRTFHLTPGTPQTSLVWLLLANSRYPAQLVESPDGDSLKESSCPFELTVKYLPGLSPKTTEGFLRLAQTLPAPTPVFPAIIHRSPMMARLLVKARRIAITDFPVLITGDPGTGKELLARAIHSSSARAQGPFVTVHCGALPADHLERDLFGAEKADPPRRRTATPGRIQEAEGGTLFLDEIEELPIGLQNKLFRVIKERLFLPGGASRPCAIDTRVIAATSKDLCAIIRGGRFREDLFHCLAVGFLHLPPLSQRKEDLDPLIDHCLELINAECARFPGWTAKEFSPAARQVIKQHDWPGNVRELVNTLTRAAIWTPEPVIGAEEMQDSLIRCQIHREHESRILGRPLGPGFDLQEVMALVARHYLERAMQETAGNKSRAAKLVGMPNYQTFSNWLDRYFADDHPSARTIRGKHDGPARKKRRSAARSLE